MESYLWEGRAWGQVDTFEQSELGSTTLVDLDVRFVARNEGPCISGNPPR
jgi:hypothetical protein